MDGSVFTHEGYLEDKVKHGESIQYFPNGRIGIHAFYYKGHLHGACFQFNDIGMAYDRSFSHHEVLNDVKGSIKLNVPFLPRKPRPLPHARSRFENLEV